MVDRKAAAAESNWLRKGLLQKIFTTTELEQVFHADEPEQTVWRLWSMKESAYKIFNRQTGNRFFAPQKFCGHIINQSVGTIHAEGQVYNTITSCTKDFIYSVAWPFNHTRAPLVNHQFRIPSLVSFNLQAFLYNKIKTEYASISGEKTAAMSVVKTKTGAPYLICRGNNEAIPLSITHHGRFAAFTIN